MRVLNFKGSSPHKYAQLDQFKAMRPVLGEEQMLDIELDRKTIFQPVSFGATTVPWTGENDQGGNIRSKSPINRSNIENEISPSESGRLTCVFQQANIYTLSQNRPIFNS